MSVPPTRASTSSALAGIYTILLSISILAALSLGREVLIPLALAILFTFLLSPIVTWLQRFVGRIAAVISVVLLVVGVTGAGGYVVASQFIDLAVELPKYTENIRTKLRSLQFDPDGPFGRLTETIEDLKQELPGGKSKSKDQDPEKKISLAQEFLELDDAEAEEEEATRVKVVEQSESSAGEMLTTYLGPLLHPLVTAGIVLVLMIFMLLSREDLRSRFIRLVGRGRISATTRAMDDAGSRVSRYLLMLLIVNVTYGVPVAIGLYLIGVPNAILWGALTIMLRFIPYLGPWIGAAMPILVSIAVSPDWFIPLMTIGLFVTLELISNNVMEPWLYGASTGVTPVALIMAAIFWTWMWGPVGLVLATPITVCLVVLGRHIPRLVFLSVMLSDEEALTPAQNCYHRLLSVGDNSELEIVHQHLKKNSLEDLYDRVLVPVIVNVEEDYRVGLVHDEQRGLVHQGLRDIVEELEEHSNSSDEDEDLVGPPAPPCRVYVVPERADRDEVAALMLAHMLAKEFEVNVGSGKAGFAEKISAIEENHPEVLCIVAVTPTRVTQVRSICRRVRPRMPTTKIVVGYFGLADQGVDGSESIRKAGADEIFYSFTQAKLQIEKLATPLGEMEPAPIPEDEELRLQAVAGFDLGKVTLNQRRQPFVEKLAKLFEVEMVLVSLISRDKQVFLAQTGLPEALVTAGELERRISICGHVVAANDVMIIEDLARDRRFANNPLVTEHHLRFYAGAPLRTSGGKAVGCLSLIGLAPQHFTKREILMLNSYAEDISHELQAESAAALTTANAPGPRSE